MEPLASNQNSVNYFGSLRRVLKVLGISLKPNESFKYKMYSVIYFAVLTLYIVVYIMEIFKHELEVMVNTVLYQFAAIMSFAKAVVVLRKRLKLGKLLDSLEREPFLPNPERGEDEQKIIDKCVWMTNAQAKIYWTAVGGSVLFGFVMPFTKRIQSDDYHDWEFSYGPITALNVTYSPNYELSWLFQTVCMNSFAAYFCAIDLITAAILAHVCFQFKIFQNYIRNIVKVTCQEMKKDAYKIHPADTKIAYIVKEGKIDNAMIPWNYLKRSLKNMVEYHLAIINIVKELETMFSSLLLLVFVSTLGLLALLVYRISTLSIKDDRLFRTTGEMLCACGQTLIICFWGEEVLQESQLIANAVFQADFVGTDLSFQKGLILIMCRSQRATVITAKKFTVICLSTFAWILQKSYSAYMVLQHANSQDS